ncbi:MAG: glycosyltransferase family 39 protein [Acidobacteriota bacterium]
MSGPSRNTGDRPAIRRIGVERIAHVLVLMGLSATLAIGVRYGTLAVGDPASSCTVGQARMIVDGLRWLPSPLPGEPFSAALSGMFAPAGFVAMPDRSGRSVPACPAGLSVAMAAATKLGGEAALFLLVPLFGVLAVWSTHRLGTLVTGPWGGVASALLLVCSPLFISGVTRPISDVPVAALWVASLAAAISASAEIGASRFRRAIGAGLLAGVAIMFRPLLWPLAVVPLMLVWPRRRDAIGRAPTAPDTHKRIGPTSRGRVDAESPSRAAAAVVMGVLPGVATAVWLHWRIHGAIVWPEAMAVDAFVGPSQIVINAAWQVWWVGRLHTPLLALALFAPIITPGVIRLWLLLGFATGVWALALPFGSADDWQRSRALLPALPILTVLAVDTVWSLARRIRPVPRGLVLLALVGSVGGWWVHSADQMGVFGAKAVERKFREVARYAATKLSPEAVIIADLPGSSVRHYADMPTLSWSAIPSDQLDGLLDDLRKRGYTPILAVDVSERRAFTARFDSHSQLAALDWPARMTIGGAISIYDPADRARHLSGEKIAAESVTWPK